MIFVFARKDIDIVESGYDDAHYKPATFGVAYVWSKKFGSYPALGKTENLFITAHGSSSEIGDAGPTLTLGAEELAKVIHSVLPGGYTGNIYISTCNSYDIAQAVKVSLSDKIGKVYGVKKSIDYAIQGPDGSNWVLA
jgi:hypothetical protein